MVTWITHPSCVISRLKSIEFIMSGLIVVDQPRHSMASRCGLEKLVLIIASLRVPNGIR
jgi:hypothetical protein